MATGFSNRAKVNGEPVICGSRAWGEEDVPILFEGIFSGEPLVSYDVVNTTVDRRRRHLAFPNALWVGFDARQIAIIREVEELHGWSKSLPTGSFFGEDLNGVLNPGVQFLDLV